MAKCVFPYLTTGVAIAGAGNLLAAPPGAPEPGAGPAVALASVGAPLTPPPSPGGGVLPDQTKRAHQAAGLCIAALFRREAGLDPQPVEHAWSTNGKPRYGDAVVS